MNLWQSILTIVGAIIGIIGAFVGAGIVVGRSQSETKANNEALKELITETREFRKENTERWEQNTKELTELRTVTIGVDQNNGLRGEVRELKADMKELRDEFATYRIEKGITVEK